MSFAPATILALLQCPLCPTHSPLVSPVTLHCGHTVCAAHLQQDPSSCPLPICPPPASDSRVGLRIHPDSSVVYHPAVVPSAAFTPNEPAVDPNDHAVDITVNKLIGVVSQFDIGLASILQRRPENDDHTDLEAEDDLPDVPPSPPVLHTPPNSRPSTDSDSSHRSTRRPMKRRRRQAESPDHTFVEGIDPQDRFEKELLTELTCEICFMLFYQPVTTPCQHTFCAKCLQRSLDHNSHCPMCRTELPDYAFFQNHPCNKVVLSIILNAYPEVYEERGRAIEEMERHARLDMPIFVCQLSFPGVPTVLHFFEPRYRLMLRRCLESPTPRFGMIMPPRDVSSSITLDFGTMLQIRSVQMLPDGRSMVHTWGVCRFRILEKGSLDGYMVARTEVIEDYAEDLDSAVDELSIDQALQQYTEPSTFPTPDNPPSPSSSSQAASSSSSAQGSSISSPHLSAPLSNEALMAKCIEFVEELRQGAAPWIVQKLNDSYGPMPTDPASFTFWMALVLPIDDLEKAKLLPIRSPRLRLRLVMHWVDQLKSNWWFTSGCAIA